MATFLGISRYSGILNNRIINLFYSKNYMFHSSSCLQKNLNEDVESFYVQEEVQSILKGLTKADSYKVFGRKHLRKAQHPSYRILSQKQMELQNRRTDSMTNYLMQLPPYLVEKPEDIEILSINKEMEGFLKYKHVFIDISKHIEREERLVVVRDTDGTLRTSKREERQRIQHVFYPLEGKFGAKPKIFEEELMKEMLTNGHHLNMMKRLCVEYDPDTSDFIQLSHRIYEDIDDTERFDILDGSRFFGTMAYHLINKHRIDRILVYKLQNGLLKDAGNIIKLYNMLHNKKSTDPKIGWEMSSIQNYISAGSKESGRVELALQQCLNNMQSTQQEELGC